MINPLRRICLPFLAFLAMSVTSDVGRALDPSDIRVEPAVFAHDMQFGLLKDEVSQREVVLVEIKIRRGWFRGCPTCDRPVYDHLMLGNGECKPAGISRLHAGYASYVCPAPKTGDWQLWPFTSSNFDALRGEVALARKDLRPETAVDLSGRVELKAQSTQFVDFNDFMKKRTITGRGKHP